MEFHRIEYSSAVDNLTDWYLYHDAGTDKDCVVVLHGHGSHGDQLLTRPDLAPWVDFLDKSDVSVVSPNLRDNAWMSPSAVEDLRRILEEGKKNRRWRRIMIASGSMGGTGALIFAIRHPELVDGLAVLGATTDLARYCAWCGSRPEPILPVLNEIRSAILANYHDEDFEPHNVCLHTDALRMPLVYYHGEADEIIPVSEGRTLARLFSGKGHFHYHEIQGGNHDSPLPCFRDALKFLLEHKGDIR